MANPLSVVLVSGGLDSCVTAAIAAKEGDVALLHVNYGQRTEEKELKCFNRIAKHFRAKQTLIVDFQHLKTIGASSLTDKKIEVPKGDISRKDIPSTYVPFRNANLLSAAVSWAEAIGARSVYIGAVEEDSSGYPDCREGFFRAFEEAVGKGTRPDTAIKIKTPLIRLTKKEIVKKGVELNAPFDLTWSCYKDSIEACGECDSCLLRMKGFKEAGIKDPLPYRNKRVLPFFKGGDRGD